MQCPLTFKDVTELTSHEINTGHGSMSEGKDKGHRCTHCGKVFVRATNLQVHLDCVHKDLRDPESASMPSISLEPSSEAEALSHVASGIATSLSVGDSAPQEGASNSTEYIVPEMGINDISHEMSYSTDELDDHPMIMLIDNENYQQQDNEPQQQPQQLSISDNEQIVMQGTEDGMIVYIHGSEETDRQTYENYHTEELTEETEEIVEEVVEEVEEKVVEEEEEEMQVDNSEELLEECNVDQVEEVIQYVEEQTEIVEYDEQCSEQSNSADEPQESVMIIEEEHVDEEEQDVEQEKEVKSSRTRSFSEWDEDSRELVES